jgi:hypothetical protein
MKTILAALLLLSCVSVRAQELIWEKRLGASLSAEMGDDVIPVPDGGFVAVGRIATGMLYLARTTGGGDPVWEETLPGLDSTVAVALYPAEDSTFYIVGSTRDGDAPGDTAWHPWIAKLDVHGNLLWQKTRGTGRVRGADRTADGGFILTGAADAEALLAKLDGDGELVWSRSFHRGAVATGASVRQTSDGGYIVVGSTTPARSADADVLLLRANGAGDSLWAGAYMEKFVSSDDGYCVEETADGGFVFAGVERRNGPADRFGKLFLAGIGAQGEVRWLRAVPLYVAGDDSLGINNPYMSRRLADGSIAISGATGPDNTIPFLLSLSADGTITWRKMLGEMTFGSNAAISFRPLADGGFIVTGVKLGGLLLARVGRAASGVEKSGRVPERMELSWGGWMGEGW